jgi:hypothetical protein
MKCEVCGIQSESDGKACPRCGHGSPVVPVPLGGPGTVGSAMANGSDEVRNSNTPTPGPGTARLANPGRPPGEIIEGVGG